jgi:hypothetical protein
MQGFIPALPKEATAFFVQEKYSEIFPLVPLCISCKKIPAPFRKPFLNYLAHYLLKRRVNFFQKANQWKHWGGKPLA